LFATQYRPRIARAMEDTDYQNLVALCPIKQAMWAMGKGTDARTEVRSVLTRQRVLPKQRKDALEPGHMITRRVNAELEQACFLNVFEVILRGARQAQPSHSGFAP